MVSQPIPVMTGDIGGTNARLSIILINDPSSQELNITEIDRTNYKTFNYPSLKSILSEYIQKFKNTPHFPQIAVLGIAAALTNNKIIVSNAMPDLNGVTGTQMASEIGIKKLIFLNDFNINGYSIQSRQLDEGKDYIQINPSAQPEPGATKVMIGAGTGLGVGYLTKTSGMKYYSVHSSEGGQQDFSPTNLLQLKYKEYLMQKLNVNCPTVENACSGSSISLLYAFLKEIQKEEGDKMLSEEYEKAKGNQDKMLLFHEKVIQKGINNECSLCRKVVNMFVEIYGSVAGNIALSMLPFGGIYLLGGVSNVLAEYIQSTDIFMKNFVDKGGMENLLEKIPVFVIINKQIGIDGAAVYAKKMIGEGCLDE